MTVTRFAPSPNGPLHLGHAYSAIVAHDLAREAGGRFLLRIEDIDGPRSRSELADEFRHDLEWLGLEWEEVPAQSTRLASYEEAARGLLERGYLYPCTCTRAEIEAMEPRLGSQGAIYPGTCKGRLLDPEKPAALRLDLDRAMADAGELTWEDELAGQQIADPREAGDVVIVRKDAPASYHLAATLDDAADAVTLVTRGQDLFPATHIHRLLQALLGLPVPRWHHHALLLDESGQKLAKRRGSPSLADRRKGGEDGLLLAEQLRLHRFPAGISLLSA
ncbi:tRNA glutamyl-Q(34) synthetase GluQRS [Erythrobacter sp.]|uniref:tRNA glutamyl-Q(34) synthetase GluQRS n=1 Tax=Erythrobacter sp. TaxID=1042 RepID=UPI001B20F933|nr:tRNA glutamyl-Q(34) synthetase GluQRS [Erythrobacter sp.]MBO6528335.1 tRNA glutamyl-Q(34) synthetase GluQRS [Erythrobacter sp.]MBO6531456.1 tRNA glutamyl-Q(34) synthetase GluQRS [Erythrobacter sp.]